MHADASSKIRPKKHLWFAIGLFKKYFYILLTHYPAEKVEKAKYTRRWDEWGAALYSDLEGDCIPGNLTSSQNIPAQNLSFNPPESLHDI